MRSKITEMAYSREQFRERVQEKVAGAYLEALTANIIEFNGETKWVFHKRGEVERLLTELSTLQFVERKDKWDGKVAAAQAAKVIFAKRSGLLTTAKNSMKDYFKRPSARIPSGIATAWFEGFEERVSQVIGNFLY